MRFKVEEVFLLLIRISSVEEHSSNRVTAVNPSTSNTRSMRLRYKFCGTTLEACISLSDLHSNTLSPETKTLRSSTYNLQHHMAFACLFIHVWKVHGLPTRDWLRMQRPQHRLHPDEGYSPDSDWPWAISGNACIRGSVGRAWAGMLFHLCWKDSWAGMSLDLHPVIQIVQVLLLPNQVGSLCLSSSAFDLGNITRGTE